MLWRRHHRVTRAATATYSRGDGIKDSFRFLLRMPHPRVFTLGYYRSGYADIRSPREVALSFLPQASCILYRVLSPDPIGAISNTNSKRGFYAFWSVS